MTTEQLDELFRYRAHKPEDIARYERLRAAGHMMAEVILATTRPGMAQDEAIRKTLEAVHWGNAAVTHGDGNG